MGAVRGLEAENAGNFSGSFRVQERDFKKIMLILSETEAADFLVLFFPDTRILVSLD
tara:strand:- start:15 stop:185 length:171 start_codon:yes stop_codon:yes gene_type:complete